MFTKLIRLGRDSESKVTQSGKKVLEFTGAYDVGYGQNKRTQWVKCSLWGERGEKVQQYLLKGSQVVVTLDDLEAEAYIKKNTSEAVGALKGRVVSFDFAGERPQNYQQASTGTAPQQQQAPQAAPQQQAVPTGFDDFDDDIPF